jgi:hypothetical protein
VFCGFVTLQKYSPADVLQGRSVASTPHPMLPFKVAHVEQDGPPLRMVLSGVGLILTFHGV